MLESKLESKDVPMTFEQKVKIALIRSGITQKELAEQVGVTRQYLNGVIRGKIESPTVRNKLCNFIGGAYGS